MMSNEARSHETVAKGRGNNPLASADTQASRHKICADRGMQRIDRSFYLFSMGHNMEADLSPHTIKKGLITAIRMQLLVGGGKRW